MKNSKRVWTGVLVCIAVISGLLTLAGILILPAEIAPPKQSVHENIYGIGYDDYPENKGILITFEDTSGLFIYFDFSSLSTYGYVFSQDAAENAEEIPFFKDYTIKAEKELIFSLCDRLGGIEMRDKQGEESLYFSPALISFCEKELSEEERLQLCISFFDKFAKTGLSSEDFMFIIENTQTDLSYSVVYDWIPHIKEMFCNYIMG